MSSYAARIRHERSLFANVLLSAVCRHFFLFGKSWYCWIDEEIFDNCYLTLTVSSGFIWHGGHNSTHWTLPSFTQISERTFRSCFLCFRAELAKDNDTVIVQNANAADRRCLQFNRRIIFNRFNFGETSSKHLTNSKNFRWYWLRERNLESGPIR